MKGRRGKTPLLVDEPALLSDREVSDNDRDYRKENSQQQHQRRSSWKQRLGFGAVVAYPDKEPSALHTYNYSSDNTNQHPSSVRNGVNNHHQADTSLISDPQPSLPERNNQHEQQRSSNIDQMMELTYDDNEEGDEEKTAMFNDEDLFAVANLDDRTAPRKTTPKTPTVTFFDERIKTEEEIEQQGDDDDGNDSEFEKLAAQATSEKNHKIKPMTISRSRAMLSRPFGRSSLPQSMVKVSKNTKLFGNLAVGGLILYFSLLRRNGRWKWHLPSGTVKNICGSTRYWCNVACKFKMLQWLRQGVV
jgi:hypothetical protein